MSADLRRQRESWESLRTELLHRIALIDSATPWQETEPEWWLQMMAVQRAAFSKPIGGQP